MDNQHQKIKGYRDLSQAEIDLMNKIKASGESLQALIKDVRDHNMRQYAQADIGEAARLSSANPDAWRNHAEQELATGIMKLVRAVAQPTTF